MENRSTRDFLRHTVATVAYRGAKATANAPDSFGDFKSFETTRTPLEILAHIGDLFDWALSMAIGQTVWNTAKPLAWEQERERFFATLKRFDDHLASDAPVASPVEKLFQGPVADALTHVGQLNLLRRMFESPVRGENYFKAEIEIGRIGAEQSTRRVEFE